MALDKAVDSAQLNADLTAIADAIRTKGGTSAQLAFPDGFVSAVQAIKGAPDLQIVVTTARARLSQPRRVARRFPGRRMRVETAR